MIRILHIDDDPEHHIMLTRHVAPLAEDFDICSVETVERARELLGDEHFDCILCDYKIPGYDGLAFLRELRAVGNDIPFILVTGFGDELVVSEAFHAGADDYCTKNYRAGAAKRIVLSVRRSLEHAAERKQKGEIERALRSSEQRFRDLVESARDLIAELLPSGKFVAVNQAAEVITGRPRDYWLGRTFSELIHPDDLQAAQKHFDDCLKQKDKPPISLRILCRSGETRILDFVCSPILEADSVVAVHAVGRDMTKQHQAEEALRESEARFRALFESALDSIFIKNEKLQYTHVNPAMQRLFHRPAAELVGLTDDELFGPEHGELIRLVDASVLGGKTIQEEHTKPIGGAEHSFSVVKVPKYDSDGNVTGLFGIARDITDRKRAEEALAQSEERFRTLFENTTIGFYRSTPDGRLLMANPALLKILGYSDFEELAAQDLEDICIESGYPRGDMHEMLESDGYFYGLEVPWKQREGSTVILRESARAIRDDAGKIAYYEGTIEDITERKRAEEALAQSEQRYRDLVEKSQIAIHIGDEEGNVTYFNDRFCQLFGYSPEQMREQSIRTLTHPDDLARVLKIHNHRLLGKDVPSRYDFRGVRSDGSVVYLEIDVAPLHKNGDIVGTRSYIADVTERVLAEKALRESEEKYRMLVESVNEGISIVDDDENFVFANKPSAEILGLPVEELVGRNVRDFMSAEQFKKVASQTKQRKTGVKSRYEVEFIRADGRLRTLSVTASPLFDENGQYRGSLNLFHDITERRHAENLRQSLYRISEAAHNAENLQELYSSIHQIVRGLMPAENLSIAIFYPDEEIVDFTYVVDQFEKPYKRKFADGILDYMYKTGQPLLLTPKIEQELVQSGKAKPKGHPTEIWLGVPLKSQERTIGVLFVQSYTKGDTYGEKEMNILQFVSSQIGMAIERKRASEELRRKNNRLQEQAQLMAATNQELESFAYTVSHDLQAPLRRIISWINFLESDGKDELGGRCMQHLQRIRSNSEQMKNIIEILLSFSRMTSAEISRREVDLAEIAGEIVKQLRSDDPQRKVRVVIQEELVAQADPDLIRIVLSNLLRNAWKFSSGSKPARIAVGSVEKAPETNQGSTMTVFFVRDNGIGFDPDKHRDIFLPFSRLQSEQFEGKGVGLATVQRIIHRHGGRVWAEAKEGKGATFYFTLG